MNLDKTNFGYIHYWFDLLNITYSRFQKNQDFKKFKINKISLSLELGLYPVLVIY